MDDHHMGHGLSQIAIYPSKCIPYITLLLGSKFLRCFGLFLCYDLLKYIHIVKLLFLLKIISAVLLVLLQKPFSQDKNLTTKQWLRVCRHAFCSVLIQLAWLYGLVLSGPLRGLLVYEHSQVVVIAAAAALFTNGSTNAKFRGAVFFVIAFLGILLFDHDHTESSTTNSDHHTSLFTHIFHHLTSVTGLSDHKAGVVLLFVTLCLKTGFNSFAKRLSHDIGGNKRLNAMSTVLSSLILLPWAGYLYISSDTIVKDDSHLSNWVPLVFVIVVCVYIVDFYIESTCQSKLDASLTAKFGGIGTFIFAVLLSVAWNNHGSWIVNGHNTITTEEHSLSGGAVFSFVLYIFATFMLTSVRRGSSSRGSFIGYSPSGLPLYRYGGEMLQRTSASLILVARQGMLQIWADPNSKKIFMFLIINLIFAMVELVYGAWTNSLGLISDGFHMLFDCSALVMGLYAAVMTNWKPTRIFSYGFDRVEILSGFINALFLVIISVFILIAGVSRLFDPPTVSTDRLLVVSIAGFLVNMIGIMSFSHAHTHGGAPCPSQNKSSQDNHGHSHGGHGHGHSHAVAEPANDMNNTNMEGVFLHILADTLGSVGVIVSSFLIQMFGWHIADPICSLFIGILIFLCVLPLIKTTCNILLLRTPIEYAPTLSKTLAKLSTIDGVEGYREEHFWRHSSKVLAGIIHIRAKQDTSDHHIVTQVQALFRDSGVSNLTVQVERPSYYNHLTGLGVDIGLNIF